MKILQSQLCFIQEQLIKVGFGMGAKIIDGGDPIQTNKQ